MRKLLLNLTPGEPLALMKKLPCFDDPIEFDSLLVGVLCLGVHDLINCHMFDAGRIEFCRGQLLGHIQVSRRGGKYGRSSSTLNTGCNPRKGGILNSKSFSPTTLVMV
jgi:hypothetical protein